MKSDKASGCLRRHMLGQDSCMRRFIRRMRPGSPENGLPGRIPCLGNWSCMPQKITRQYSARRRSETGASHLYLGTTVSSLSIRIRPVIHMEYTFPANDNHDRSGQILPDNQAKSVKACHHRNHPIQARQMRASANGKWQTPADHLPCQTCSRPILFAS